MHVEGQKAGVFVLLETRYSEMTGCRKFLIGLSNSGMKPLMDGYRIPFIFKSGGDGPGLGTVRAVQSLQGQFCLNCDMSSSKLLRQ